MRYRFCAGICILLLFAAALPVSALSVSGTTGSSSVTKTGMAVVTFSETNGTGMPVKVAIAYSAGDVAEISPSMVVEDPETGLVTVTVTERTGTGQYVLMQKNDGDMLYRIQGVAVAAESDPLLVNDLSFSAAPAMANYYADTVPEGKQHEWIDLDWKDPAKDLGLTIYAPDETFGPYSDTADGRKDGRIFLDISSILNLTPGTWFFKVQNSPVDTVAYTLNTYSA